MKGESIKEIIFNTFKIKYELLDSTFLEKDVKITSDVSIYVDMNSLLDTFYKRNIIDEDPLTKENYMNFTAYVLNMLIHYRRYMCKIHKRETRIYLIYRKNSETQMQTDFTLLRNCINTNMKLISELCPFIPGVYFIDSGSYPNNNCVVQYLINYDPERFHWVISKSITDIQSLCALGGDTVDNILVTILKYDRKRKSNTSVFLYRGHIFKDLIRIYNSSPTEKLEKQCDFLDRTDTVGLIPIIELTANSRYIYCRTYNKIIDTVYKHRKDLYTGLVVDIANYELFPLLYSKDEIADISEKYDFGNYITQAYMLVNTRMMIALFNREDEHCIISKVYDLKNRSLTEINNLEYMEKRLYVDVEDLIKGGDIKHVNKPAKVKW